MKQCSKCRETKPITQYWLSSKGNPLSYCKTCYTKSPADTDRRWDVETAQRYLLHGLTA